MPSKNVNLVRAWIYACNADDPDLAVGLCHPDFEMTESASLPGPASTSGHDELRRYFAGWRRNWSEWEWIADEVEDLPPDHVLVMARLRLKGLPSGAWVEHRWAYLFTVRDGLLARQDGFDDRAAALAAARA